MSSPRLGDPRVTQAGDTARECGDSPCGRVLQVNTSFLERYGRRPSSLASATASWRPCTLSLP